MGKFLTDVNLNQNEIQNVVIQNLNADPIVSTTGQIYYNDTIDKLRLKTPSAWVSLSSGTVTIPTLQQVVNSGNGISNYGGIGNASIQSTNFTNNRTLYLNDNSFPTIRIVDNGNSSHNLTIDLDTLNLNGTSYNWSNIVNPPVSPLSALPFTTDHLVITNNQYVIGDLVWYLGNVYRCIANNDSIIPTSTLYWTNLGPGYSLVQQPIDYNSTSGNNQILNKPTIPIVGTWGALNYPTWVSGTPFVKMTGVGTFSLDTNTYLTAITSGQIISALGYTPENVANKTTNLFLDQASDVKYPSAKAVVDYGAAALAGYVPTSRTLTINGTTYDLTTNRSWTITASGKSINVVSTNTNAGSGASTDYVYLASGTINITLPTAVGNQNLYTIKNVGTGVITINTTSSQTIDGSLTAPIRVQYLSLTLISDGANWNII